MDALKEITSHSAYKRYDKQPIWIKRMRVIEEVDKLKSLIASHNLSERVTRPGQEYAHYKECGSCGVRDDEDFDYVDTCVCCHVAMYRYRILQLLDEIEAMSGGSNSSILKRIKNHFIVSRHGDTNGQ